MRNIARLAFHPFVLLVALLAPPLGAWAEAENYKLALIRDKGLAEAKRVPRLDIEVLKLNSRGELLTTAALRLTENVRHMYPSGKVVTGTNTGGARSRRNSVLNVWASIPSDTLNQTLGGSSGSVLEVREKAEPETSLDYDALTSSCMAFLVSRNLAKPQPNPKFGELFLQVAGVDPVGGLKNPMAHTESMKRLIARLMIEDRDYHAATGYPVFGREYSNRFEVLLSRDMTQGTWEHICGSGNERYFFGPSVDMFDGKVIFYRARNYESISSSSMWEAPIVSTEGGWEMCLYDAGTKKLEVLTDKGYRKDVWPGPILWSPDGSRLLFEHAEEWFYGDPVHNEFAGPYVYDCATKKHYRPTGKCPVETAICWLPDSVHYLVNRSNLYNPVTGRPRAQEGYFVVDAVTRGEYPLILVADDPNLGDMIQGLGNQARQPSQFAFSPDGALLCFTAFFDQDGATYSGIFVMRNQPGAVPVLIERSLLRRDYRGIPTLNYHAGPLTWLR